MPRGATKPAALSDYVYRSEHVALMRRRRQWFEPMAAAHLVLWWVPAGETPGVHAAMARLETRRTQGPGPAAFTFRSAFAAPS